jgi:hypothetical protein
MDAQRVEQMRIKTVQRVEHHRRYEVEPLLRISYQLQMKVWRRAVVQPLQRVQQALPIDLELLSVCAESRRIRRRTLRISSALNIHY